VTTARLRGARVVVTRAADDRGALDDLLAARGAEAIPFPCIAFDDPLDLAALDEALRALGFPGGPSAVALSSPQAVRRFHARLLRLGLDPGAALRNVLIGAVGAGTAAALSQVGLRAAVVPAGAVGAEALAAALAPRLRGQRVLLPRAEEGNPALAEALARAGAEVHSAILYRTVTAPAPDPAGLAFLRAGLMDGILFASGSAARGFAALLGAEAGPLAARAKVACMGARCAAVAREAGLRVDAVARGGFEELLDALAEAFG
jgi:uroporphyrinogen III methyltransferase/synthase